MWFASSALLVCVVTLGAGVATKAAATETASAPACALCHAAVAEAQAAHPIAAAPPSAPGAQAPYCTGCHQKSANHPGVSATQEGGTDTLMRFGPEASREKSATCLGCHQSIHSGTAESGHQQAGLACSDCHRVHRAGERAGDRPALPLPAGFHEIDSASALCAECHQEILTRFTFSERHRLAEGSLSCVSCHDPHRPRRRSTLSRFNERDCSACHEDKSGPFVFEHGASRVDGCLACHDPHGGPNRHLLTHQRVGELCLSCHTVLPQFHVGFAPGGPSRFDQDTVCTNCHTSIHGSNFHRAFLR